MASKLPNNDNVGNVSLPSLSKARRAQQWQQVDGDEREGVQSKKVTAQKGSPKTYDFPSSSAACSLTLKGGSGCFKKDIWRSGKVPPGISTAVAKPPPIVEHRAPPWGAKNFRTETNREDLGTTRVQTKG